VKHQALSLPWKNTLKTANTLPTSLSKERQSLSNINHSSAAEDVGQSIAIAVEIPQPAPSEANSHKALENSLATSKGGVLNSI